MEFLLQMSKRNWITATAFGLALCVSVLHAQEVLNEQLTEPSYTREQASESPLQTETLPVPASPIMPTEVEHYAAATEDGDDADGGLFWGDGIAQWVMALTGIAAFFLSAWAVWLLKRTLDATREMIREAEKTTVAAMRSVDIQNDDRRPWIAINAIVTDRVVHDTERNLVRMRFKISLFNSGRTAATNVVVEWRPDVISRSDRPDFNGEMKRRDAEYIVAPNGSIEHLHIPYTTTIDRFQAVANACPDAIVVPVLIVRVGYKSPISGHEAETIMAFSVYRRNEDGGLPALTIMDTDVSAQRLFIANEGGTAS